MSVRIGSFRVGVSFSYVIEGEDGVLLVDAGLRRHERQILGQLGRFSRKPLRLIFITHAHMDHYGSAAALRDLTGAPIGIHRDDAGAMARGETPLGDVRGWGRLMKRLMPFFERHVGPEPAQADVLFGDGDRLERYGIDATVVHTPGHTPGSSTLVVDGRIALVGDLLSMRGWPHPQLFYATDWSQLAESLRRLQELDIEWAYTGHGPRPMSGDVLKKLKPRGG